MVLFVSVSCFQRISCLIGNVRLSASINLFNSVHLSIPSPPHRGSLQTMAGITWVIAWLALAASARAQVTCENYGVPNNSSSCACPPGFGGATCSAPACGGNIFQGTQRPLISNASATSFGNVSTCSCSDGWTGTGCNVCQASTVCQSSFVAAGASNSSTPQLQSALNNTLNCNTIPRVFAAGEMSCAVIVRILPYSVPRNFLALNANMT